jgi:cellulose synthase/poly-beta-1,6-N-acetylglucosamine synthase-like glycosyltransferase
MAAYGALATGLHVSLILLIIQRRELSDLDRLVFWYLLLHLAVDGIRLLLGIVILLCRGFPRLADLGPEDWPAVSVVIPCHNEAEVIAETIRSLYDIDYPDLRIIVVDDGSSDDTAAIAAACGGELLLVRQPAGGKAAALNAGLALVRTPLTLLVDADCVFPRDGLRNAVRHLIGEREDALGGHLAVLNRGNWLTLQQELEYGDWALRHFFLAL